MLHVRPLLVATLASMLGGVAAAEPQTTGPAPGADRIALVLPGGELLLGSGQRIKLADLRFADTADASSTLRGVLASLRDAAVQIEPAGPADRWNRQPAALSLTGQGGPVDIGELLVGEGLAVVDAGERNSLTRTGLLAVEEGARTARRGVWAQPGWPVAADARDELAGRAGRFAVVEGRVVSVGERRGRTYLNFGRDWSRDFAVTISRRTWTTLVSRGLGAAVLTGAQVRVRGILKMGRAPGLDIAAPEMLEIVAEAPGRAGIRPGRR